MQEYLKKQELQEKLKETNSSSLADPLNDKPIDDQTQMKITKMMRSVFTKLDALCNFHYTPRAVDINLLSSIQLMHQFVKITNLFCFLVTACSRSQDCKQYAIHCYGGNRPGYC